MSLTVCIGASNTLRYPQGGHLWVFINWAAGFRANGCKIVWLDVVDPKDSPQVLSERVATLRARLAPYDLADTIALVTPEGQPVLHADCLTLDHATSSDLLFDLRYDFPRSLIQQFRRTAMLDIDPGILQIAMQKKDMQPAPHDVYFTIGESVGQPGSRFPSLGLDWVHTPPCVSLEYWPVQKPTDGAYTTVSHWYMHEFMLDDAGNVYRNDKREAFQPFMQLPRKVKAKMELAIHLNQDPIEQKNVEDFGWSVKESHAVASTPADFQNYIQHSRGEFGCAKPAYVKLQTSWISDRTLCYLASGKPAIVQNTGPTRYFDGHAGVRRFNTFDEAVHAVESVEADYDQHAKAARELAERHFAAKNVAKKVLERCEV